MTAVPEDSTHFGEALALYRSLGWERPFPLDPGTKDGHIPTGVTGHGGQTPSEDTFEDWYLHSPDDSNLGLVAQDGVLGIDVDQYDLKRGFEQLKELEGQYGQLPRAPRSSARGKTNPSGIRWFRVPKGKHWRDKPAPDIEIVSWHHRFGVVWPSINPHAADARYSWHETAGIPAPGDLPELPEEWITYLSRDADVPADFPPATPQLADRSDWHPEVAHTLETYRLSAKTDLHGSTRATCMSLCRAEIDEKPGATSALAELGELFMELAVDHSKPRSRQKAAAEWARLLNGGRGRAQSTLSPIAARLGQAYVEVEYLPGVEPPPNGEPEPPGVLLELQRLRDRARAQELFKAEQAGVEQRDQTHPGGDALLDQPPGVPAVWGSGDDVLWSQGEPLLLVAPPGVGKTTLIGQVVAGLVGLAPQGVLGWPVTEAERVLYLASDRPRQIKRSLRRRFMAEHRQVLNDRLILWEGPPPVDLAQNSEALVELCVRLGASHVILDSLKDMAVGLTDDTVGAGMNRSIQLAIAEGIEVCGLHHQRKGQNGTKPKTLEDVYGSTWITAGAGSVVLLWGQAGDHIVELSHLKQPASPVGPLKIEHDHAAGRSSVQRGLDELALLRNRGHLTSGELARVMFDKSAGAKVTDNERAKAKRKLQKLVDDGYATVTDAGSEGGPGGSSAAIYRPTAPSRSTDAPTDAGLSGKTTDGAPTPPTLETRSAGQSTDASTDATDAAEHRRRPPYLDREAARAEALIPVDQALESDAFRRGAEKAKAARRTITADDL